MSILSPNPSSKPAPSPWTTEVRIQAQIAIQIAAELGDDWSLAYMLRAGIGHGLTVDECCQAGGLERERVIELINPWGAAA